MWAGKLTMSASLRRYPTYRGFRLKRVHCSSVTHLLQIQLASFEHAIMLKAEYSSQLGAVMCENYYNRPVIYGWRKWLLRNNQLVKTVPPSWLIDYVDCVVYYSQLLMVVKFEKLSGNCTSPRKLFELCYYVFLNYENLFLSRQLALPGFVLSLALTQLYHFLSNFSFMNYSMFESFSSRKFSFFSIILSFKLPISLQLVP